MSNRLLNINKTAEGAVTSRSIIKPGSEDGTGSLATGPADPVIGISLPFNDVVNGQRFDLCVIGIAEIVLGGPVTYGDPITSDPNGNGVTATTVVGQITHVIGIAQASGIAGDWINVLIAPSRI